MVRMLGAIFSPLDWNGSEVLPSGSIVAEANVFFFTLTRSFARFLSLVATVRVQALN
jgi:hypothetical protein